MTGRFLLVFALAAAYAAGQPSSDRSLTAFKLRQYCEACHGLGELQFIPDGDDDELWDFILTQKPPGSTKLWAERMIELLDWPSDAAPSNIDEPQWMPKGSKRPKLAADLTGNVSTRRLILSTIRAALGKLSRP